MQWPNFFPDNCPPSTAFPANGKVYRFVKKDPPKHKDFYSHRQNQPNRNFNAEECVVCGISVFKDIEDALSVKRIIPAFKKRKIAEGTVKRFMGKMLHTPSNNADSHHTWWIPDNTDPSSAFVCIKIE